jgi:hypothetical protein
MLKAVVIADEKRKFEDVGDVLAVARSLGKQVFRTQKAVYVKRLFFDPEIGWVAVVADSLAQAKKNEV